MSPLPRKTEDRAIMALKNIVVDHPTMDENINTHDKELSWDGYIRIFQSDDVTSDRANFDDDIPVQVKGHVDNTGAKYKGKERITASVELEDLRNYYRRTGCLYFVIYMNDQGKDIEIFYSSLYPSKIKVYLDKANRKGNTNSISLPFLRLKKDCKELFLLCKQFSYEIRKQGSGLGQIVPKSIMGDDLLNVKKVTVTTVGARSPFDMLKSINTGDAVLYGSLDDSGVQFPLQVTELTASVREVVDESLYVDEKKFYNSFEIERTVNSPDSKKFKMDGVHIIRPSKNVTLVFGKEKLNISYKFNTDIHQLKRDAEFILELLDKGEIRAFNTPVPLGKVVPKEGFVEQLKSIIEVGETLEEIGINILAPFAELTDEEKKQIDLLMNFKHGCIKFNTNKEQFVYYWEFRGKQWPVVIDQEKKTVIGLIFNTNFVFSIGSPTGQTTERLPEDAYIVPNFVRTEPEVLANLYSYDYEAMYDQIDRSVYVEETAGLLNELSLHLISAYDISGNEKMLELATEVLQRLQEKFPDGEDTLINLCQIEIRITGELSTESNKKLDDMALIVKAFPKPTNKDQADVEKVFSYCVSVLRKDIESAERIYQTLTETDKKGIEDFPIRYLHQKIVMEVNAS